MIARFSAECLGTFVLVLFGCGAAVLGGDHVGQLGIALAFGFAIVAVAYGLGAISGAHVNPAVSLAMFVAGRMSAFDLAIYWSAQFLGATLGAGCLAVIAGGVTHGLGENGWGVGYLGAYSLISALVFEVVATAIFAGVVLGATSPRAAPGFAGLAIGVTLAAIHIVGIQVTGVSVNPARSFGPAVIVGGPAMAQLWLFLLAPALGAVLAALPFRAGLVFGPVLTTPERTEP